MAKPKSKTLRAPRNKGRGDSRTADIRDRSELSRTSSAIASTDTDENDQDAMPSLYDGDEVYTAEDEFRRRAHLRHSLQRRMNSDSGEGSTDGSHDASGSEASAEPLLEPVESATVCSPEHAVDRLEKEGLGNCSSGYTFQLCGAVAQGAVLVERALAALPTATALTRVTLRDIPAAMASPEALAAPLHALPALSHMIYERCDLGSKGFTAVGDALRKRSRASDRLRYLALAYGKGGAAGIAAVAAAVELHPALRELDLSGNSGGYEGATAIARLLMSSRTLRALDYSNNAAGPAGAEALSNGLEVSASLLALRLAHNDAHDRGIKALAVALRHNNHLRELDLSFNNACGEGARALARSLGRGALALRTLSFGGNTPGAAGFALVGARSGLHVAGLGTHVELRSRIGAAPLAFLLSAGVDELLDLPGSTLQGVLVRASRGTSLIAIDPVDLAAHIPAALVNFAFRAHRLSLRHRRSADRLQRAGTQMLEAVGTYVEHCDDAYLRSGALSQRVYRLLATQATAAPVSFLDLLMRVAPYFQENAMRVLANRFVHAELERLWKGHLRDGNESTVRGVARALLAPFPQLADLCAPHYEYVATRPTRANVNRRATSTRLLRDDGSVVDGAAAAGVVSGDDSPSELMRTDTDSNSTMSDTTKDLVSLADADQSQSTLSEGELYERRLVPLRELRARPEGLFPPAIRFWLRGVYHAAFLVLLFATIEFSNLDQTPSALECMLTYWVLCLVVEEVREIAYKKHQYRIDVWNALDLAGLAVFLIVAGLRAYVWMFEDHNVDPRDIKTLSVANDLFVLDILLWSLRILHYVAVHRRMGPLLSTVARIGYDVLAFLLLSAVFLVGSAMAFSVAFKNRVGTSPDLYADPIDGLDRLFFGIFDPNIIDFEAIKKRAVVGRALLGTYLLGMIIVLVNLLIAMLSTTYTRVEQSSRLFWHLQWAQIVLSKIRATPTPFVPVTLALRALRRSRGFAPRAPSDVGSSVDGVQLRHLTSGIIQDSDLKDDDLARRATSRRMCAIAGRVQAKAAKAKESTNRHLAKRLTRLEEMVQEALMQRDDVSETLRTISDTLRGRKR